MLKETDLYEPLKSYLENQNYEISSEVNNCDMVARRDEEIIIVELKTRFSLDLVYQAVRRLKKHGVSSPAQLKKIARSP